MKQSVAMIKNGFESSCSKTPEFMKFVKTFKKEFKEEMSKINATNMQFNVGHFYISGYYTLGGQSYYFSMSDVRYHPEPILMFRTVNDYKDYSGGNNRYVSIDTGMSAYMN